MADFIINTARLIIRPFDNSYLKDYYREFTDEITKYQYPDGFSDMETADKALSAFAAATERGDMLELVLLTQGGEFLGSIEVFGLREETPEIGLWLKTAAQGAGYGFEALNAIIEYLRAAKKYRYYLYEADVRNTPSIRLAEKFQSEKGRYEEITTESGKQLRLQTYHIYG